MIEEADGASLELMLTELRLPTMRELWKDFAPTRRAGRPAASWPP